MFLDKIVAQRQLRLRQYQAEESLEQLREVAGQMNTEGRSLRRRLEQGKTGIIAEIKRASPSLGKMCEEVDIEELARSYDASEACAISVLTEPDYFLGSYEDLQRVRVCTDKPILNKDFIIEEWQIYKAKCIGADVILLIAALLPDEVLGRYSELAKALGLEVLMEVHDEEELLRVRQLAPDVIGINNRNLRTFEVSILQTLALLPSVPDGGCVISESGIKTESDIRRLKKAGIKGFLIGETLMRATDPKLKVDELQKGALVDV